MILFINPFCAQSRSNSVKGIYKTLTNLSPDLGRRVCVYFYTLQNKGGLIHLLDVNPLNLSIPLDVDLHPLIRPPTIYQWKDNLFYFWKCWYCRGDTSRGMDKVSPLRGKVLSYEDFVATKKMWLNFLFIPWKFTQ